MGGTKSSISPLEEIAFLPKIVETLLKEIELHKTLSTKDSSKKETRLQLTKSENTKEEKAVENPQMKKDLKTTKNNSSRQNECLCTIENLSIDNFCVLLAMVIVKTAEKRLEHLPERGPSSNELSFLKFLEIETELLWHINR